MICDDCIKKDVCRLKEGCNILERDMAQHKIEDAIQLSVSCKHRETRQHGTTLAKPTQPYNPQQDVGRTIRR